MTLAADDPEAQARVAAFTQELQELGWSVGRNLGIDYRCSAGDAELTRKYAGELVALAPSFIAATASPSVVAVQQASCSSPIGFVNVMDYPAQ
jgi:putative tryptophan/tyrosine transport system substrate-binding protein